MLSSKINGSLLALGQGDYNEGLRILLQSGEKPEVNSLSIKFLNEPKQVGDYRLDHHQQLKFLLTANPVKTIPDQTNPKKKCRVPLIKTEQQQAWLERKLENIAQLEWVDITNNPPIYFKKHNVAGKIVPVTYQGILRVKDPEALTGLVKKGLGPAKSFGCGLLSLARA